MAGRWNPMLFLSRVFFTASLVPLFSFPRFAAHPLVRRAVAASFGRMIAFRYHKIIAFYGDSYGGALRDVLDRAGEVLPGAPASIIDCGTGTGFAAGEARRKFPQAKLIVCDMVIEMLSQARRNLASDGQAVAAVLTDSLHLPFKEGSVDLVMSQNSVPFLEEFARVSRRGGLVIFVDTAATWMPAVARRAARAAGRFDMVTSERSGLGFFLLARRAQDEPTGSMR